MEAVWFKSGSHRGGLTGELPVVGCFSFCGREVANGFEQAVVVKPGHPFERSELNGLLGLPGRSAMDQFGLVEPVDRLSQGVVVAVALALTDGSIPASARRSLYRIDTYCEPRSE